MCLKNPIFFTLSAIDAFTSASSFLALAHIFTEQHIPFGGGPGDMAPLLIPPWQVNQPLRERSPDAKHTCITVLYTHSCNDDWCRESQMPELRKTESYVLIQLAKKTPSLSRTSIFSHHIDI